jgi:hypothetical protein
VVELNSAPTSGTITLQITKDAQLTISFDGSLTAVGSRMVQNSLWSFDGSNPSYYVLTTTQPLAAASQLSVGLSGVMSPGATAGALTVSATVVSVGGGEAKLTNNIDADKIEYFQQ